LSKFFWFDEYLMNNNDEKYPWAIFENVTISKRKVTLTTFGLGHEKEMKKLIFKLDSGINEQNFLELVNQQIFIKKLEIASDSITSENFKNMTWS
jgi:hypothetical protein